MHPHRWISAAALMVALLSGAAGCSAAPAAAILPAASTPTAASAPAAGALRSGSAPARGAPAAASARPVVAPRGTGLPPGVAEPPAGTTQLVTVLAPSARATAATLRTWQRESDGSWRAARGPVRVRVGTDGVGRASERTRRTPAGTFTLDQAFGRAADPGTRLPYRRVGNQDWWVSDTRSVAYNTYRRCAPGTCPFDEGAGENLGRSGPSYDHALVIGYNTARPVAGAGSAFFLHVDAGVPSAGCVVVPRAEVIALLRWLDPAGRPRITIGTS